MINFIIETILYYPIWATLLLIPSVITIYFASINLWKFFNIILTFTSKINKLKPGKVEIKGKVKLVDAIAGLKRKAVYYKKVNEVWVSGKNGGWKPKEVDEKFLPFKVIDSTGEVIVIPEENSAFDIKYEIVPIDSGNRIRYHFLEEDEDVYVLGNFSIVDDEGIITKKEGTPFIISDFKESSLMIKHATWGFGFTAIAVITISVALFFASTRWNKSWEGSLQRKNVYVTGSGKNSSTHYQLNLVGGYNIETNKTEYQRVKVGDYLIKYKKRYDLEIKHQNINNRFNRR